MTSDLAMPRTQKSRTQKPMPVMSEDPCGTSDTAGLACPVSLSDDLLSLRLELIGELARAVERACTFEEAATLALRCLCHPPGWVGGLARSRHTRSPPDTAETVVWHPPGFEAVAQTNRQAPFHACSVPIRVGEDTVATLELFAPSRLTPDPAAAAVCSTVGTLLGRLLQQKQAVADRARSEIERRSGADLLRRSEEELREQHARLFTAINNMRHGLAMYDGAENLVICNDLYATMYSLTRADVRPGTHLRNVDAKRRQAGYHIDDFVEDGAFETHGAFSLRRKSRTYQLPDGRSIFVSVQALWDGGWVSTHEDITERQRFEDRIAHLAHHDALTNLANRVLFRERLDREMAAIGDGEGYGERPGEGLAVLWLDLDRFKPINDTLGHIFGDAVLKAIAQRLQGCVRHTDLVARLGGDEFAILQCGVNGREEVGALARRVREAIKMPLDVEGQCVTVDVSIGICLAPGDTSDTGALMRNADIALYGAKADGRCTHRFFEAGMDDRVNARRQLEMDLRTALEQGCFELNYQPIVNLESDSIIGCEALLRWRHPTRGPISPDEFIPVAEESGMMVQLGSWVLARACNDAVGWPDGTKVAVNLSPSHVMSAQLTSSVMHALEQSGLAPERLEIEITEAVLLQNSVAALQALGELRTMGVQFAMDDFGTGYSSLSYLRSFPFDKIKIDRSFVRELPHQKSDHAIVKAITSMSASLGLVTTAEGVETAEQLAAVRALGCTQMQGYLFSRPIRNQDLQQLFANRAVRSTAA